MLPSRHLIASLSLGALLWVFTHSILAGFLCLVSGVLVDVDHLIDYLINVGLRRFSLKDFYWTCVKLKHERQESRIQKTYLIFHSWELVILFGVGYLLFRNIYLLAIALGYTGHLILDATARALHPLSYFISYRLKKGFKAIDLFHS
jgi:hypothetical protein